MRRAFFLIPIVVAFRLTPWLTAAAGVGGALAYTLQALEHSATRPHAGASIGMFIAYLLWIAGAAALLSALLERRTARIRELADTRQLLLVEVQEASERERRRHRACRRHPCDHERRRRRHHRRSALPGSGQQMMGGYASPGTASLLIRHQRARHAWSLNGRVFKAAQQLTLDAGSSITVVKTT